MIAIGGAIGVGLFLGSAVTIEIAGPGVLISYLFAALVAAHVGGLSPTLVIVALVTVYFFSHYFFSSLTAHTTAMMPIMLGVGLGIPGLPPERLAVGLALTTGIMGVISPYATGAALPYYNCGYIKSSEFWRNGTIYGAIFLAALLLIGIPLL